jgi:hypothetical protein
MRSRPDLGLPHPIPSHPVHTSHRIPIPFVPTASKVSIPIFWGRYGSPMPHRVQLTLAVGKPIIVPKPISPGAEPSADLVNSVHAQYVQVGGRNTKAHS